MWNTEFGGGQQSGGFLNTSSQAGSAEKKRPAERLSNVVACTISQILKMGENDENLKIGSMSARIVTFVGLLQSVDVQSTKVTFVVNDMSGPSIEVQVWLGENEEVERKVHSVRENTYVRVTGAVRSMKGRRHVIAFKVTPITEVNEITMHILEVIHTSMAVGVMDKQGSESFDYSSNNRMDTSSMAPSAMTFDSGSMNNSRPSGLSKAQQIVFQAITATKDAQGANIFDLFNNIKSLNRAQIKEAVEFLSNEGHIYSTIDDEHFKSTE